MNDPSPRPTESADRTNRLMTVPNLLCVVRLLGSFVLLGFAFAGWRQGFLGLFLFLAATDWIDGKLAVWLNQRTVLGARLDSWADAALYSALLIGGFWLGGERLRGELVWVVPALISYGITTLVGILKFKRWPSYHTRAAKTCWFLISMSAIAMLVDWSLWPLRITMVAVVLTNLEATGISIVLRKWEADVPSILHAWRIRLRGRHNLPPLNRC